MNVMQLACKILGVGKLFELLGYFKGSRRGTKPEEARTITLNKNFSSCAPTLSAPTGFSMWLPRVSKIHHWTRPNPIPNHNTGRGQANGLPCTIVSTISFAIVRADTWVKEFHWQFPKSFHRLFTFVCWN